MAAIGIDRFMQNYIREIISKRRTIHDFQYSDLPQSILDDGLKLAVTAPNHRLTFPWQVKVVGRNTRAKLITLALELKKNSFSHADEKANYTKSLEQKFLNPAALIVFGCKKSADPLLQQEDYAAVCCAIQNFTLYMQALNLGCKWSTGDITSSEAALLILGFDPNHDTVVGFIWVGIPRSTPKPQIRPDLSKFVQYLT